MSILDYDVAISRFGTMFFADPVEAFGNIAHALRPDGRLVLLVWRRRERNEWAGAIHAALGVEPLASTDGPFSLGDPAATTALAFVRGFSGATLERQAPADADRALDRLRDTLAAHHNGPDGVTFDSRAWIITARR